MESVSERLKKPAFGRAFKDLVNLAIDLGFEFQSSNGSTHHYWHRRSDTHVNISLKNDNVDLIPTFRRIYDSIGDWKETFRRLREDALLTREGLAHKMGYTDYVRVGTQRIGKFETKKEKMTIREFNEFCRVLLLKPEEQDWYDTFDMDQETIVKVNEMFEAPRILDEKPNGVKVTHSVSLPPEVPRPEPITIPAPVAVSALTPTEEVKLVYEYGELSLEDMERVIREGAEADEQIKLLLKKKELAEQIRPEYEEFKKALAIVKRRAGL